MEFYTFEGPRRLSMVVVFLGLIQTVWQSTHKPNECGMQFRIHDGTVSKLEDLEQRTQTQDRSTCNSVKPQTIQMSDVALFSSPVSSKLN